MVSVITDGSGMDTSKDIIIIIIIMVETFNTAEPAWFKTFWMLTKLMVSFICVTAVQGSVIELLSH